MICFGAVLASGLIFHFLGSENISFSPELMLVTLAALTLIVSAYAFWLLPEFALRFVVVALTHSLYRIRISGEENIPEKGPALLVANHVSFVDGLLISACSSRIIHFLMHEDYYRSPFLYPLARIVGFIEVPNGGPRKMSLMFEQTKDFLRRGEVVCVFPEGKLTRNGLMDEFKGGINRMMPEGMNVPIIPIRLGMIWGSIFSYYYGRLKFRFPRELPHPASVSIGPPAPPDCTPFELRQIVSELGAEAEMLPRPKERPLHCQFVKVAKQHPFRKLLKDGNGVGLTAFETLLRGVILSREIRKLVPEEDKFVAVLLPNTSAETISLLAILFADKVPAPLNYTAARESLDSAVCKAGITKIITSRLFLKKINMQESPKMLFLEDIAAGISKKSRIAWTLLCALLPCRVLLDMISPESHRDVFKTAVLLFSSGSTGTPKGVLLSHHNINSDVYSFLRIMGWQSTDGIAGNLPLFHSFGFTTCFWLPLTSGCQVAYIPNPLDGKAIGEAIAKHKLTLLLVTPSFLQSYMRKWDPKQLSSLRLVVSGAEKLRHDIAEKFKESTGLAVVEGYGCTELSPVVSINIGNSILNIGTIPGREGSIGAPMPGICVKIVDPETRKPLPPDTEGLMLVKGPNVMQGYLNDPEKTAEVLRDNWYNTGDIARMNSDGYLTITGRLSRFSKIAGEMVPHEMVEANLAELALCEDRCVAVSSLPDPDRGERLVVLVTSSFPLSAEDAVAKLRERNLPNLWIPRVNSFYKIAEIPMLGTGKLDLPKLKELTKMLANS
ncbi:MAG: hypothetical protein A2X49_07930 [Lentisphaerae bacterium GWF2_52_8]|nr:MAG: hypothetical protein A2X49_07930 [Lentisphaerae bacterium GWF2_52_8]